MKPIWQIHQHEASCHSDAWTLQFNVERPQDGLAVIASQWRQAGILRLQLPGAKENEPIADCYSRGSDLVVAYTQHDQRTVRPHLYHRILQMTETLCVVQAIVSMQTDLLDSEPQSQLLSTVEDGELLRRDGSGQWRRDASESVCGFLLRPADQAHSFFQLVHPTDYWRVSDASNDLAGFDLFAEPLEKGVIRRARVLAGWCPRSEDLDVAEQWFQQQLREAPPLTT